MRIPKCVPDHWQNERHRKYFGALFNATPPWLSKEQKKAYYAVYSRAKRLRKQGRNVQVDHIVPLISKYVCGLNVPWNIEIIDAGPNGAKGNRYWPGCPWENHDLFGPDPNPQQLTLI